MPRRKIEANKTKGTKSSGPMQAPGFPADEKQRLGALRALKILDTPPEERFDRLTRLAQGLFGVPIALVTLVDATRQWFKSRQGLDVSETPRDISFCGHAILGDKTFVVPDARRDPRFTGNPLVTGDPRIRFYAGCPLSSIDGSKLGTLCIIDRRPREVSPSQVQLLKDLAALVERELNSVELSDELRQTHERLELIVRATNDAVWDWNLEANRIWWGHGLSELFGHAVTDGETDLDWWEQRIHPDDREKTMTHIQRLLDSGGRVWSGEYRFRKNDGSYADVFDRGSVIRGGDGKPVRMIGAMVDITERKKLEDQLHQAQKMEAVGSLAGGVAHDFNNILTAISGYSGFIRASLKPPDPMIEDVEEVKKAVQRATSLTRQLLVFSRKSVVQPKVLDINSIVSDIDKMLRRLIEENIKVTIRLERELGHVKADPGYLEQILLNLSVNARDAMAQGGSLMIQTANEDMSETVSTREGTMPGGRYVVLSVADTGSGMPPEVQDKIFEPFFTTKGEGKGTGLGLSTVHGIVKQSGGHILLESEVGKGTTFRIYFPRVDVPLEKESGAAVQAETLRGTETILLVEDEQSVREIARRTLRSYGYTVMEATTGNQALEILRGYKGPIDLVLTDVVMPEIGGYDLADQVSAIQSKTKFLFMTGYTDPDILQHRIFDQGIRLLQKPFLPELLARTVREVLTAPPKRDTSS